MRALLVVDGRTAEQTGASIASALSARGYEPRSQPPAQTFDRDVRAADLLVVGFVTQGLMRGRAPATVGGWAQRLPRMEDTPAAVFAVGRGADHALAAVTESLAARGAEILVVRVFPAAAPTDGAVPFTDAFMEAIAERRGS